MPALVTLRDKALVKAVGAVYGRTMSMPLERSAHTRFPMGVTAVEDLAPQLRRFTFAAPELTDYEILGPDEYFGLFMPPAGRPLPELPQDGSAVARGIFRHLPEDQRPDLRWYTIRRYRPEQGEIDVDIVTHGDSGPGSRWALRAQPGDVVGLQTAAAGYRPGAGGGAHVLLADDTAVPALCAVLEQGDGTTELHAVVETADEAQLPPLPQQPWAHVTVVGRDGGDPGSAAQPALESLDVDGATFGWLCGEQTMVKQARRHLVQERGMDRRAVFHTAYWIQGRPRG